MIFCLRLCRCWWVCIWWWGWLVLLMLDWWCFSLVSICLIFLRCVSLWYLIWMYFLIIVCVVFWFFLIRIIWLIICFLSFCCILWKMSLGSFFCCLLVLNLIFSGNVLLLWCCSLLSDIRLKILCGCMLFWCWFCIFDWLVLLLVVIGWSLLICFWCGSWECRYLVMFCICLNIGFLSLVIWLLVLFFLCFIILLILSFFWWWLWCWRVLVL